MGRVRKKDARGNQMSFITKDYSKAIRSPLCHSFLRTEQTKTRSCMQNKGITVSQKMQKELFFKLE